MFDVFPLAVQVNLVFSVLLLGSLAILLRRPVRDKAELQIVASPVDTDFILVAVVKAFYVICFARIIEGVLLPVIVEIQRHLAPEPSSTTPSLPLARANVLNGRHEVVGNWPHCQLELRVLDGSVKLNAQNFASVSLFRHKVYDVKLRGHVVIFVCV